MRSSSRGRGARRLAWACARAVRAVLIRSRTADAAADEGADLFVDGDAAWRRMLMLRWSLFHMKRSCSEGEVVAVACSLSPCRSGALATLFPS